MSTATIRPASRWAFGEKRFAASELASSAAGCVVSSTSAAQWRGPGGTGLPLEKVCDGGCFDLDFPFAGRSWWMKLDRLVFARRLTPGTVAATDRSAERCYFSLSMLAALGAVAAIAPFLFWGP